VPEPWSWQTSGFGTAGVVREQPDGRCTYAFFWISLLDDGIKNMFGKDGDTTQELERFLRGLVPTMPPFEEGPAERAAEFIWGAYALGDERGISWPPEAEFYLAVVPKPPGDPAQWRERLVGPHGLTPSGLVRVIEENPTPEDIPEEKEVAIFTKATFRIRDQKGIVDILRNQEPELSYEGHHAGKERFVFTRAYPPGHESPFARMGGRQIMGDVAVGPDRLIIEVQTLSRISRLISLLKPLLGDRIVDLEDVKWTGAQELLGRGGRR
jgi:hypothetical protein